MRRTKTVFAVIAVMAAMLVALAAPAMADDNDDWNWWNHSADSDWYDEVCSPDLPDGYYVPGCIFSDADDDDDFRFVSDNDFDDDFDHFDHFDHFDDDDDNNNDDNERESVSIIR
jgi:hypothetical protein